MSKGRSLQKQVVDALKSVTRLGQSRHQAKRRGTADRFIYSVETLKTYTGRLITAVKWIKANRNPDLKELREIRHEDWFAYISDAEAAGQSGGGLRSTIAALHKLESGLRERQWWTEADAYIPPITLTTPRSGARGGFSEAEVKAILQRLDGDALLAAQLAHATGLRLNEVYRLQASDIDLPASTIRVRSASAKGGRERTVTRILDQAPLRAAHDRAAGGYIFAPGSDRRIQDAIRRAVAGVIGPNTGGKNIHSLRASYADQLLRTLMADGLSERTARQELALQLGHGRTTVTYRYVPRLSDSRG